MACPSFVFPNSDISILPSAAFVRKPSEDVRNTMAARRRMRGTLIMKGPLGAANQRIENSRELSKRLPCSRWHCKYLCLDSLGQPALWSSLSMAELSSCSDLVRKNSG